MCAPGRMRACEDRESITTSVDSYPFSPSSPWAHALPSRYNRYGYPVFPQKTFGLPSPSGPVSFAGFSSPPSQLTSSSFRAGLKTIWSISRSNNSCSS